MAESRTTWGGSLHQTFRLLPEPSAHVRPFLESDGKTPDQVLDNLPYDAARGGGGESPDPKRYRDGKQLYQTAGLLYEDDEGIVQVTRFGATTLRWLDLLNEGNAPVLGTHAAYALAACQLRNPTGAGSRYDESMVVFPFSFIWRAMLRLEGKISSAELNRAIFKVKNVDELEDAIDAVRAARAAGDEELLGEEVVTGSRKNDRIIPWISLASFGYTLIADKSDDEEKTYYTMRVRARGVLERAASLRFTHHEFGSAAEYTEYVSDQGGWPPVAV
ncbi:MAG: hypothetical protein AABM43_06890 [Actinomycetota bacterium]